MLGKYMKFNGETVPNPTAYSESADVIETQWETESGGINANVSRYDRLKVSVSFDVSSAWQMKLKTYSKMKTVTVSLYDTTAGTSADHTMIIRNYKSTLVPHSERTDRTNGIWQVSFDLQEV